MTRSPITIYTDGACSGNPGPGGFGVVMNCAGLEKVISAGYRCTTNNRMELLAVITGLEAIRWEKAEVVVWSDSSYVVDAVEKGWVFGWESKGFVKKANEDLWRRFLTVFRKHNVSFRWIRGHNGHPQNERCDRLAVAAAAGSDLLTDEEYERINKP